MEEIQEQVLDPSLCGSPGGKEKPAKEKEKKHMVRLQSPDSCVLEASEESISVRKEYIQSRIVNKDGTEN